MSKPDLSVAAFAPVPDVFFQRETRDRIYLVSWIGGGILSAVAAALIALVMTVPGFQIPVFVVIVFAVWNAAQSWFVAPLAKANTFASRVAAGDASS